MMGHNLDDKAKKIIQDYSASLARSTEENDIRKDLRDQWEEIGQDTKALQDGISRSKKNLKKREGYDESMSYFNKLHEEIGGSENLFSWVVERENEKEKEREEVKANKAKAKKAEKAKADEFKPAPERKPKPAVSKPISGKDAAEGEKVDEDSEKSVGVQQAAA